MAKGIDRWQPLMWVSHVWRSRLWGGLLLIGLAWLAIWIHASTAPAPVTPAEARVELPQAIRPPAATPRPRPTLTTVARPAAAPVFKPSPSPTLSPTPAPVVHIVRQGEMLGGIALAYGVSVEAIMAENRISDPTTLQIGQELRIPITPTPAARPATAKPTGRATPTPAFSLVFHTIEAGDTMLAIAATYDIPVETLLAANRNINPNNMPLGQKLLIPPEDGSLPDPILWAPTAVHEIESGDTLLGLAVAYGSSVEDILATNPDLDPDLLQIGQAVAIPLTEPRTDTRPARTTSAGSAPPPSLSAADVAALRSGSPSLVGLEQAMINAVNAERQAQDLTSYTVDEQLVRMAWGQAQDMVSRGYFSHVTPEGRTLRDRFREQGLATTWVGENIYLSVQPADRAVSQTLAWFMGDAPHRRNLLHPNFNRIGVGVAQGASGWYTFVLVFAGQGE